LTSWVPIANIRTSDDAEKIGCGVNVDMNQAKMHKWSTFLFLVPSSFALAYFVFYMATFTPSYANTLTDSNVAQFSSIAPAAPDKIILVKGKTQTIGGRVELTYQGLDTGYVVIDITLLDLDRHYAYRRKIPKKVAHRGFQLAQRHYQLISANRTRLKIMRSRG
jgi:hypothetical protein